MSTLNLFREACGRIFIDRDVRNKQSLADRLHLSNRYIVNAKNLKGICDPCAFLASGSNNVCSERVFNDVEFFSHYVNKSCSDSKSVFDTVNCCVLEGGKVVSQSIYSNPISDADLLLKRQKYLQELESICKEENTRQEIDLLFETMCEHEHFISWMFEEREETIKDLYDTVFFRLKGLRPLNKSGIALTAYNLYRILLSPIFGIVAPLVYFIIPYIVLLYKFRIKLPFKLYLKTLYYSVFQSNDSILGNGKQFKYVRIASYLFSAVFYFQGIFTSVDVARTVHKISRILVDHLHGVVKYLSAAHQLALIMWDSDKAANFNNTDSLCNLNDESTFVNNTLASSSQYKLFSAFGNRLKMYKLVQLPENINLLKSIVAKSFIIDALLGALRYKEKTNSSFVKIYTGHDDKDSTPHIHFVDMAHPCLPNDSVRNTIVLGVKDKDNVSTKLEQNAIITSPNSSGKSILIKALVVNVIMAQTMSIQCAREGSLTPLARVTTQMHVPDTVGYESLFEAEMHRCKENLDMLQCLQQECSPRYSLIVMDEIFNSTNPIEAIAGAYAVCKRMAKYRSNILLFTTHFKYLTKLVEEEDCHFVNYRMQTQVDNNNITFTYKLERGVNKHLLALELLRKSGFESSILDDALALKKRLEPHK